MRCPDCGGYREDALNFERRAYNPYKPSTNKIHFENKFGRIACDNADLEPSMPYSRKVKGRNRWRDVTCQKCLDARKKLIGRRQKRIRRKKQYSWEFCPYCTKELEPDWKCCPYCGKCRNPFLL